jgi:hypothetical protein
MLHEVTTLEQTICRITLLFLHYFQEKCAHTLHTVQTQLNHQIGCCAGAPDTIRICFRLVAEVRLGSVITALRLYTMTIFCEEATYSAKSYFLVTYAK